MKTSSDPDDLRERSSYLKQLQTERRRIQEFQEAESLRLGCSVNYDQAVTSWLLTPKEFV